jgi:large subunit ribosomal protein L29
MNVHEIRELSVDELKGKVKDLQDQVFRLRIQKAMGQLDASHKVRQLRRELARVKTVLTEKR